MNVCVCVRARVRARARLCMCAREHVCVCVYVYACMYVCNHCTENVNISLAQKNIKLIHFSTFERIHKSKKFELLKKIMDVRFPLWHFHYIHDDVFH
jgi:hypothetical protein